MSKSLSSRSASVRLIDRAKIILLAAEGMENKVIANQLSMTPNTIEKWRNRFAQEGIKSIGEGKTRGKNHGGKKTLSQARLRQSIIRKKTQEKPPNATHWSTRSMAQELSTTHSFVNRVWQPVGLKPHLEKTFKVSMGPDFEEMLSDVVGLYLNPPENAVVFCVDEKSSIQALDRTPPDLPLKKGAL